MMGKARRRTANLLMGRWRITEMDLWEQDDIDLVAPGFVEFDKDHRGSLGFITAAGRSSKRAFRWAHIYFISATATSRASRVFPEPPMR
jgi:hypothetical protein